MPHSRVAVPEATTAKSQFLQTQLNCQKEGADPCANFGTTDKFMDDDDSIFDYKIKLKMKIFEKFDFGYLIAMQN